MNQLGERLGIESEFLRCDCRQEFCAGFVRRIVKFLTGMIGAKIRCVRRRQERALMMIEPPRQPRRARILEINNRVLVAVENIVLEWLRRPVRHPRITKLHLRIDSLAIKSRKNRRRRRAVKTLVVEKNSNRQLRSRGRHLSARHPQQRKTKKNGHTPQECQVRSTATTTSNPVAEQERNPALVAPGFTPGSL